MKNIRIGNMEYKEVKCIGKKGTYEEIVRWSPNKMYNAQERLKSEGWTIDEDGCAHRDNMHYDASCFKNPESCYMVAEITWNRAHDEFDVTSCGTRAFDLEEEDFKDFKTILKLIEESVH